MSGQLSLYGVLILSQSNVTCSKILPAVNRSILFLSIQWRWLVNVLYVIAFCDAKCQRVYACPRSMASWFCNCSAYVYSPICIRYKVSADVFASAAVCCQSLFVLARQVQLQWSKYNKQAGTAKLKPALTAARISCESSQKVKSIRHISTCGLIDLLT